MTPKEEFIEAIIEAGLRLGFSLAHEDTQGGFIVHKLNEEDIAWLRDASDDTVPPSASMCVAGHTNHLDVSGLCTFKAIGWDRECGSREASRHEI